MKTHTAATAISRLASTAIQSVPFRSVDQGTRPADGGLLGQYVDGGVAQHTGDGSLRVGPHIMGRAPLLPGAGAIRIQANVEPDGPFDRLHDFEQRGRPMDVRQFESAGIASMRDHQARSRKALEHFREKLLGTFRRYRQFRATGARVRRQTGEVNHHPDGVVCGSCELHNRIIRLFLSDSSPAHFYFQNKRAYVLDKNGPDWRSCGFWRTQWGEAAYFGDRLHNLET